MRANFGSFSSADIFCIEETTLTNSDRAGRSKVSDMLGITFERTKRKAGLASLLISRDPTLVIISRESKILSTRAKDYR